MSKLGCIAAAFATVVGLRHWQSSIIIECDWIIVTYPIIAIISTRVRCSCRRHPVSQWSFQCYIPATLASAAVSLSLPEGCLNSPGVDHILAMIWAGQQRNPEEIHCLNLSNKNGQGTIFMRPGMPAKSTTLAPPSYTSSAGPSLLEYALLLSTAIYCFLLILLVSSWYTICIPFAASALTCFQLWRSLAPPSSM